MGRATDAQKATRLNRARTLLRQRATLPAAVERLAADCAISPRQAYRYLQQAQRLSAPVPVDEAKLAFTVKLPISMIRRVRVYATATGTAISEVVSQALLAFLTRRRSRG
jgi:predicted DNA-binding transcriptional regulator YafY